MSLTKNQVDLVNYHECVQDIVNWCSLNFLELNVTKTKALVFGFGKQQTVHPPTIIYCENIALTDEYKYLGTVINHKLNWSSNNNKIHSKSQQRVYFLRKLNNFRVEPTILNMFYKSVIESVMSFCLIVYFGNSNKADLHKLTRIIKQGTKLTRNKCMSLDELFTQNYSRKVKCIMEDSTHPLYSCYKSLHLGIRLATTKCRTNRFLCSLFRAPSNCVPVKAAVTDLFLS